MLRSGMTTNASGRSLVEGLGQPNPNMMIKLLLSTDEFENAKGAAVLGTKWHAVNPLEFWLVNLTPQYLKFQNSRASKLGPLRLGHFCRSSRSGGRIVNDDPRVTAQRCKGLGFCSKHLY